MARATAVLRACCSLATTGAKRSTCALLIMVLECERPALGCAADSLRPSGMARGRMNGPFIHLFAYRSFRFGAVISVV
jgi:hypothetical protein